MKKLLSLLVIFGLMACQNEKPNVNHTDNADELPAQTDAETSKVEKIANEQIPAEINFEGNLVEARTWQSSDGEHFVIFSSQYTEESGDIFAYEFLKNGDKVQQLWSVQDEITNCSLAKALEFLPESFQFSDFDKNNETEVWFAYKNGCRGGMDPVDLKILMFENGVKYEISGKTALSEDERNNNFTMNDALQNAPAHFKSYFEQMWHEFQVENLQAD